MTALASEPAGRDASDTVFSFPLSEAQIGIWNAQHIAPDEPLTVAQYVEIHGDFDVARLEQAARLCARDLQSPRLRIVEVAGNPRQVVGPDEPIDMARHDFRSCDDPRAAAMSWMRRDSAMSIPLLDHRLFESAVLRTGDDEYLWYAKMHHIAIDGYGAMLLVARIAEHYTALTDGAAPSQSAAKDLHSIYESELAYRESAAFAEDRRFWRGRLNAIGSTFSLSDRYGAAGAERWIEGGVLPATCRTELDAVRERFGASRPALLTAGVAAYLAAVTGRTQVTLSLPVTARTTPELRMSSGYVSNVVPLHVDIAAHTTVADLVGRVDPSIRDALRHQRYRHEDMQRDRGAAGEHRSFFGPVVNIMLFHNGLRFGRAAATMHLLSTGPVEDLSVNIYNGSGAGELHVDFIGNPARYTADELRAHHRRFLDYLTEFLSTAPESVLADLAVMGPAEQELVLRDWARTPAESLPSEDTLADLFDATVAAHAGATAVTCDGVSLTYRELDARANRLARELIRHGVGPETLVAVALPRSLDLVIALLAVIKAGGGYLPIDPDYPADRIAYMLTDAGPACAISSAALRSALPAGLPIIAVESVDPAADGSPVAAAERRGTLTPGNVAYVIYTSGSTGRPKGVQIPHANVATLFGNTDRAYGFDQSDVWTLFHSYAFDFSVWELWGPLLYGGTLVVVDYETSRSPELFLALLRRERVTVLNQTPSAFSQLVEADRVEAERDPAVTPLALRYIIFGGEALEPRRLADWYSRHHDHAPRLVNMYGITETTVHVTQRALDRAAAASGGGGIGRAIPGLGIFLLDSRLRPAPIGVAGEIYVSGAQLARGYLGQPALSGARFVANPFGEPGTRLYRSGDLGRWTAAGELEYLGRADDQVKVRGFRIELGEIEAALLAQELVRQAAVIVRHDDAGDAGIVAYVVTESAAALDIPALRGALADRLPEYMVPAAYVVIDAIPLTANGKLDRRALPEPVVVTVAYRAPGTAAQRTVAAVLAEVLEVERIGLDDGFFALGGNSLNATRVSARIGAELGVAVPVRLVLEETTVEGLAARVSALLPETGRAALAARVRPARIPLSPAQQRLWFINRFDHRAYTYNIPFAVRMDGDLDVAALRGAVADLLARHEPLRTLFPDSQDGPHQVILDAAAAVPELPVLEVPAAELGERLRAVAARGFELTRETALRMELLRTGAREHVLAVVIHHIAADGWSLAPLFADLSAAYAARLAGQTPQWAPLPVQYVDYSLWQTETLGDVADPASSAAAQLNYWRTELADLPDELSLPYDRPRPAVQSFQGAKVNVAVDAAVHADLMRLARETDATLFMAVHSAFAVLLARLSGGLDIAVGTPVAGRGEQELDALIGMFVNTVVFRARPELGESFHALLTRQRAIDLAAFAHAQLPFERLVEELNPVRSTARHPLVQVGLSFQNLGRIAVELPGLTVSGTEIETGVAQFDLQLVLTDHYDSTGAPAGITGHFVYATDLFDEHTIEGFAARFARMLGDAAARPHRVIGDLDLLDDTERTRILHGWNATAQAVDARQTLASLFAAQAARTPSAVALVAESGPEADPLTLTYREFSERVNRLARHLISLGVGPEARVALAVRRSAELLVGMYAVAVAGGAYVPIDPDQPAERLHYILDTAAPQCVLSTRADAAGLPEVGVPIVAIDALDLAAVPPYPVLDGERRTPLRPQHTAYVIFTSGSTGRPKGVAVPHRAVVNQLLWKQRTFGLDGDDTVLLKTAATFDLSVWEFYSAVLVGGRTVIATPDGHRDPSYLTALIEDRRVSVLHLVPSMLTALMAGRQAELPATVRLVLAIGEALPAATAQRFRRANPRIQLWNLYGPTEAAVSVTAHRVDAADTVTVPIGRPEWNSRVYVLDTRLRPVAPGVVGDLYLAGIQLAHGYVSRGVLTAERFVPDPFAVDAGERMYRTGDLASWKTTGELEYHGRTDFQVKIRGFRVELGDIEAALLAEDDIETAVVVARADAQRGDQLVAYVVPAPGRTVEPDVLRTRLAAALPAYMVPAALMVLPELPMTATGKVDRRALPEPVFAVARFRQPVSRAERAVAAVFEEVLGAERVGLDDDFFARGGNSLLATKVATRLALALNTVVEVRALFDAPTVGTLAALLEQSETSGARLLLTAGERPERIPLSLAQQRLWFLNRFDTDSGAYNIAVGLRLSGRLDTAALQQALSDVVARHEVLRTVFPEDADGPHQVVLPEQNVVVPFAHIMSGPDTADTDALEFAGTGFDLTVQPPIRAGLLRLTAEEHVLVVAIHHIAADGWSLTPLATDLVTAYEARRSGGAPQWAALPVQYADFSVWQRTLLGSEDDPESPAARQLGYWRERLAELPECLELPTDRPRPVVASHRGATVRTHLDAHLHTALTAVAQRSGVSVFMVLHAALATVLARLAATDDVAVGTPIAGRVDPQLDSLVGMFVGTLVLRTSVDTGASFADLLRAVRDTDLDAFAHAELPFERLVEVLEPVRSSAYHPLFQVMLSLHSSVPAAVELAGLRSTASALETGAARWDLEFTLIEQHSAQGAPAGIDLALTYATDLFAAATARRFTEQFTRVLAAAAADPALIVGELPMLTADEIRALAPVSGPDSAPVATLAEIFTAAAAIDPAAVAVRCGDSELTYAELDRRSNRLARLLIGHGVGPESIVALGIPRSVDSVCATVAVAKTGAAFLPVDPAYPLQRKQHMLADSGARFGLTVAAQRGELPSDGVTWLVLDDPQITAPLASLPDTAVTDADRTVPLRFSHTAYLIYTSGSTGTPKGVTVTHTGLANFTRTMAERFGVVSGSRTLHFASPSFDASVLEMLLAWSAGATMVVAPPHLYGGEELAELLERERISHAFLTPVALATLGAGGRTLPALRGLIVGGEAVGAELLERWAAGRAMFNAYGPSEATVAVAMSNALAPQQQIVLGGPIRGAGLAVLDRRLRPVPVGVAGELYIGGPGLARGYFAQPGLSAARFIADPYGSAGERLYRTGDLVRWTTEGELVFLGRGDDQVKVRGFRIELGEITAVVAALDGVRFAHTEVRHDEAGRAHIVSYVRAEDARELDAQTVRAHVGAKLPAHMVPSAVVALDSIPLSPSGKLDRRALPAPVWDLGIAGREPATPAEALVAGEMARLLGREQVCADHSFFDLGGNSLSATGLVSRIAAACGHRLAVREVFEHPTPEGLARLLDQVAGQEIPDRPRLGSLARPSRVPLTSVQRRLWFLNQLDTDSGAYNIPVALRLRGTLDEAALRAALVDVIARHEILRTLYPQDGQGPYQAIIPAAEVPLTLALLETSALELEQHVEVAAEQGFDLTRELPLRVELLRTGKTEYALAMVVHHIAMDGWSLAPLASDLMTAYAARRSGLAPEWMPLPVQYADYAVWHQDLLGDEDDAESVAAQQLRYWRTRLAALPDCLDLPADRPRPAVATHRGDSVRTRVDAGLHGRLTELARSRDVSEFMVLHAVLAVLLARLGGTPDISVGTAIAGRGEPELDALIGAFVGTLVLRTPVDGGASFTDLLHTVREADLEAFAHADLPFERLVEALNPVRSTAHHPLFQVSLSLDNFQAPALRLAGLDITAAPVDSMVAKFDLQFVFTAVPEAGGGTGGLDLCLTYATDLFDRATAVDLSHRFVRALTAALADPAAAVGDLELLAPEEARALSPVRGPAADIVLTLPELFASAAADPEQVALVAEHRSLTYGELDEWSNRLARTLIAQGAGPGEVIALGLARSVESVVATVAVAKTGAAYLPVDVRHPADRIRHMLTDSGARLGLTTATDRALLPADLTVQWLQVDGASDAESAAAVLDSDRIRPLAVDDIAYVIYTSGSTGVPKGVAVPHRGLAAFALEQRARYGLESTSRTLHFASPSFDASVLELLLAWCTGATVVVASAEIYGGDELAALLEGAGVTHAFITPAALASIDITAHPLPALRCLVVGGEAVGADLVARWAVDRAMFNAYGPSEATVAPVMSDALTAGRPVVLGRAIRGAALTVLDTRLRPVPVGVAGELYVAGAGLARGYVGRTALTAERFVANPFATVPGERMYRTGDVVRWTADGELVFVGRSDDQVKIRGFRIELGEISAALSEAEGIRFAHTEIRRDEAGTPRIVGYVVASGDQEPDRQALRAFAADRLPGYMVPTALVVLADIPLSPSGKLDRRALPEPQWEVAAGRAPGTPSEILVANAMAEVVGRDEVCADHDFFELGGTSLSATRLVAQLAATTGRQLGVRAVFEHPTPEQLARVVDELLAQDDPGLPQLTRGRRPARVPLSPAQQRLWFLNRFDTDSGAYNIPVALRLRGSLDAAALAAALRDVVERHEALRTLFPQDADGPHQVIVPVAAEFTLPVVDVAAEDIAARLCALATRGFDLATALPLRAELLRAGEHDHVLAVVVHHIAADGGSVAPLASDLAAAYAARRQGAAPAWAELPVQYADYSVWQRELLGDEADSASVAAQQLRYWTERLQGQSDSLELPADRPRPTVRSQHGASVFTRLDGSSHAALSRLARDHDASLFMVLHAVLAVLLARITGTADVTVGTPISGRADARLHPLIGMFAGTLVLRTEIDRAGSFSGLLAQVRDHDLNAFAHADIPFERLVEALDPVRTTAHHPLFQVMLSVHDALPALPRLDDVEVAIEEIALEIAKFDLQFTFTESHTAQGDPDGIDICVTYATDMFEAETAERIGARFVRLLSGVSGRPHTAVGDIDLLSVPERSELAPARGVNGPVPATLAEVFNAAAATRDAIAVVSESGTLTYGELDERSNRVARALLAHGVGPGDIVALGLPRSPESVLATVAVTKTGATFVPVDVRYPAERIAHMLTDSGARLGITTAAHSGALPEALNWLTLAELEQTESAAPISDSDRLRWLGIDDLAYIIYTSGSTGVPKGVAVTHRGMAGFAVEQRTRYAMDSDSRPLHFASPSFDASILELLLAWCSGGALVLASPEVYGGDDLAALLDRERVTHAFITPAALASIDITRWPLPALQHLSVGGEAVGADLVARWAPDRHLYIGYGPTETTIMSAISNPLAADDAVVLGRPIRGTGMVVLDERLRPVPPGVAGDLYIGGDGLARGYHRRPGLTAGRFVSNPFATLPGARMYRTGDVVRWTQSGELDFVGRSDDQVKIRGFRIELGEISAVVVDAESIRFAHTEIRDDAAGRPAIVCYVVPEDGHTVDAAQLRDIAAERLPAHMVPAMFVPLVSIPLSPTGKLDRRALPEPAWATVEGGRAPRTPNEKLVAQVMAEVLGHDQVCADHGFFELGGNSLSATQLVARITAASGQRLAVRAVFEHPTPAGLALLLDDSMGEASAGRPVLMAGQRPERVPLSLAQQRLWFLSRFDPGSAAYNIPVGLRLTGRLDAAALQQAVSDVVARHEVLRTVFPEDGQGPHQVVVPEAAAVVPFVRIVSSPSTVITDAFELAQAGFDLAAEIPIRAALLRVGPDEHVLVVVIHHIAADGWSLTPLAGNLVAAYEARCSGAAPAWPALPVQYADFSVWQRELLGSEDDPESLTTRQLQYWTERLADLPECLELPVDRPRPVVASHRGASTSVRIDAELHARLAHSAQSNDVSVFMVLHAVLAVLIARTSGSGDIAIGTAVAGRGDAALDDLIGMFVGTLVLRTRIDGAASFAQVLASVRDTDLDAFAHADLPFERLVEVLNPVRSTAHHPLFQVSLSLTNMGVPTVRLPDVAVTGFPVDPGLAKCDLQFTFTEAFTAHGDPDGIEMSLSYATDLFDTATADRMSRRFVRLLAAVLARPEVAVGDADVLSAWERSVLAPAHGARAAEPITLPELFDRAVRADHPALVTAERTLTYGELDAWTNRLARTLITRGVGPGDVVALGLARSLESVAGSLAIAKTGAAFLPVDVRHPMDRIRHMLTDSAVRFGLTCTTDRAALPGDLGIEWMLVDEAAEMSAAPLDAGELRRAPRIDDIAYLIYTSGSTGLPKGVAVTHRGVFNCAEVQRVRFDVEPSARTLHLASPSFDVAVLELLLAWSAGTTMVIVPIDVYGGDPLAELIEANAVTHVVITPAALASIDADRWPLPRLHTLIVGGEAFDRELVEQWGRGRDMSNGYGPSEATIATTFSEPMHPERPIVLGRPMRGVSTVVLDARLCPVPPGVVGELYVGGIGLAQGYHRRPELTSERFVANPFGGKGERMYRTGDLVRWNAEGELVFAGRADDQVKVRGFRIELGEISAVVAGCAGVRFAHTEVRKDDGGRAHIVCYVVALEGGDLQARELHDLAAQQLPAHMVPSAFLMLDSIPLSPNGKLDRRALPEPDWTVSDTGRAPRTPGEVLVAKAMAEVVGHDSVCADHSFFDLGGNSLSATQLVARIAAASGCRLEVRAVFEHPTPEKLGAMLDRMLSAGGGDRPALVSRPRPARIPLSPAQQRLWLLNRFDTASGAYNIPLVLRLRGALDVEALRRAVADVVARHEVLHTVFPADAEGPHQVVLPVADPALDVPLHELAAAAAPEFIRSFITAGFDVTQQLPVRAALLQLAADEHLLVLVMHHIVADGASAGPLAADLAAAYAARRAQREPEWFALPVQYADFSLWQHAVLGSEDDPESPAARQLEYWTSKLAGTPDCLTLPMDRPRPAVPSQRGASVFARIDAELHDELTELARWHGVSVFMVLHAVLAVLLGRLGSTDDVVVGTPIGGRVDPQLDLLVGMFVGTLVLRTSVAPGDTFAELLDTVRETDLDAFAHADIPFERLVEALDPARSAAHHPLFQVMLSVHNVVPGLPQLAEVTAIAEDAAFEVAKFDLQFTLTESQTAHGAPDGIDLCVTYATDLFDAASAEVLCHRFVRLLTAAIGDPATAVGDLDLLDAQEMRTLAPVRGSASVTTATFPEVFAAAVARAPGTVAVCDREIQMSYDQLDRSTNRLARALLARGVGPESYVALGIPRSVESVRAMFAVLKTGAAFVPVDPSYPAQRKEHMVSDSRARIGLTVSRCRGDVPVGPQWLVLDDPAFAAETRFYSGAPLSDAELVRAPRLGNPAYLIYTSGSTGVPKGVVVTHAGLANFAAELAHRGGVTTRSRVLHFASPSFDAAILEILLALGSAATLVLADTGIFGGGELRDLLRAERITHAFVTPAALATVEPAGLGELEMIMVGGDRTGGELVQRWVGADVPGRTMLNAYGPSEITVAASISAGLRPGVPVTIGGALRGFALMVLDGRLRPVPAGVPGELYIAGIALARGYHRRPALTAERFIASPFGAPGDRMYRTGDLVRWVMSSGRQELEYLGRSDDQVKIRGFRIEFGEINAALSDRAEVSAATTIGYEMASGALILAAYVVPASGATVNVEELRRYVAGRVPGYMVPQSITVLESLPLTPAGKLDRTALPEPELLAAATFRAPGTPVEVLVCAAFAEVLGLDSVGADDNFFELGGTSLLATRLVAVIRDQHGADVPMQALFLDPTPSGIAGRIEAPSDGDDDAVEAALSPLLPIRPNGTLPPLFCVHSVSGVAWSYTGLLPHLEPERPIYGLQLPHLTEDNCGLDTVEQLAQRYIREMRTVQPHGPYHLLGWSLGGLIAYDIATRLEAAGEQVQMLAMLDSRILADEPEIADASAGELLAALLGDSSLAAENVSAERAAELLHEHQGPFGALGAAHMERLYTGYLAGTSMGYRFRPRRYDGDLVYFTATEPDSPAPAGGQAPPTPGAGPWRGVVRGEITEHFVGCSHVDMGSPRALDEIGPMLRQHLSEGECRTGFSVQAAADRRWSSSSTNTGTGRDIE
ncbi:non-ribosomal peptide synthase/polyketide synthase [Nocardia sp. NBC_01327]|uniref:non-ribosomal peptide synthase/polyketide synthase n=1 Tax=Nocardia sp. NBC_01327 TaxID=2903593 RepID=UPI002E12AF2C|nr:non-ribosomal peptide synthase/polyketide synthase [Nocardia sp. NBC_01327]